MNVDMPGKKNIQQITKYSSKHAVKKIKVQFERMKPDVEDVVLTHALCAVTLCKQGDADGPTQTEQHMAG